jgi:alpha-tubulin suppressor-like RCC1 family protein
VQDWTDIIAISTGEEHTVGLKSDGTVVVCGGNLYGQSDVQDWTDIVVISAGKQHTVGLKSDGTVVATNYIYGELWYNGQCDVSGWKNIKIPDNK